MNDDNDYIIKLCVPMIYEIDYVEQIIRLNKKYGKRECYIYEVYGSLPADPIGNLRPAFAIESISIMELKGIIDKLHRANIRFDYVINTTIMPRPFDMDFCETIVQFIKKLDSIGVDYNGIVI